MSPTHSREARYLTLDKEDLQILLAVQRELDRESSNGDAPGHSHATPGIWDSDNGKRAGKPCAWCLTWRKFTALLRDQDLARSFAGEDKDYPLQRSLDAKAGRRNG